MARNAKSNTNVADATSTPVAAEQATTSTTTKADTTPEQQARKLRADAKALRLSAEHLTGKAAQQLLDLATSKEADADALAPRKAKASTEPRPTCTATKADGTACTAKCMKDRDVCVDHRPAVEHLTAEEVATFEAWMHGEDATRKLVSLIGWGKVRQAIKTGAISIA